MAFTSAAFIGLVLIGYGLAVWTGMIRDVFIDAKLALVIGAVIFAVGGGLHLIMGGKHGSLSLKSLNPISAITHGVSDQGAAQTESTLINTLKSDEAREASFYRHHHRYLTKLPHHPGVATSVRRRGRQLILGVSSTGKAKGSFAVKLNKGRVIGRSCHGVSAVLYTSRCQNNSF